jgi:ParB-like chromosome segregation protein Spo0J
MSNVIKICKVNQYVAISKLKLHPDNPRTIDPERLEELKDSILKKGFYEPILVWKKGAIVLSGNHRLIAVRQLIEEGWEFKSADGKNNVLPVVIEDVSAEIAEAILFEANNSYARWIDGKLAEALQNAEASGRNIKGYGFEQVEVDRLLKASIDEAEEKISSPRSKRDLEESLDLPEELAEVEEFESLILPKPAYKQLKALLEEISKVLADDWHDGDSLGPAALAIVEVCAEQDAVGFIQENLDE